MSGPVDVLAVIESCRDQNGMLNETGRLLDWTVRKGRQAAKLNRSDLVETCGEYAQAMAAGYLAATESLSKAGRPPVIQKWSNGRKRAALAACGEAK